MVKKRNNVRHRRLAIESLEKREVLTAYINELMFDSSDVSTVQGQYVELRGEPNATIDAGTYLLVISDDRRGSNGPGTVNGIFDLSGQRWGSNGLLVLLPQSSSYTLGAGLVAGGPAPTILRSTSPGFDGLPGNIYTSLFTSGDELNSLAGSASFFLIQSAVAPKLGDDIDADDNGTIDVGNAAQNWNVQDSISLHDYVFRGTVAYGQVAFIQKLVADKPAVLTPATTQVVYTESFGYAARIGDSTGHAAIDWVAGTVRRPTTGQTSPYFRFENGIFGVPEPYSFTGRKLDHIGESNFFGGVRGTVSETIVNPTGPNQVVPIQGVRFLADTNANGKRDIINYSYDPDGFAVDAELTNVFPGVTLTTVNTTGDNVGYEVQADLENSRTSNNKVFSPLIFNFIPDTFRLRIDFANPVRSVSIDAIGRFESIASFGLLEAFNSAGQSLGVANSFALFGAGRQQTLRINVNNDIIAYALAYTPSSSPAFASFDDLKFSQSEAIAVTDAKGEFAFSRLLPDDYSIVPFFDPTVALATPIPATPVSITRYENIKLNFSTQLNAAPVITAATFTISENAIVDSPVGTVVASDKDLTQTIAFSVQNESTSPFRIDPVSGELFVRAPSLLDFESTPVITVPVIVTDSVGGTSTTESFVKLTNINEPPVVALDSYILSEKSDNNSVFGRVNAFDPEFPDVPPTFVITGGSGANVFSIDKSTGVLSVTNAALLDFETKPLLELNVTITDSSTPSLTSSVTIDIALTNANDPPVITSESFDALEGLLPGVSIGTVLFAESDVSQTHTFRLVDDNDGLFRIDTTTGVISLVGALDFETSATHEIIVQVVDSGTPPQGNSKAITIRVANEDEPATLNNVSYSIQENSVAGSFIGSLIAIDPEGVVGLRFASLDISNPTLLFGGRVRLNQLTGGLTVVENAVLDAESASQILSDRVRILDGTANAGEALLTLVILNVNEAPVIAPQQRFGLPLGLPSGRVFGEVVVSDPEKNAITLEVIGAAATQFGIDVNKRLFVLPGVTIDFASDPEIEVQVRATDSTGLASTGTITVTSAPRPRFGTTIPDRSFNSGAAIDFSLPVQYRAETVRSISVTGPDGKLPEGLTFDPVIARILGIAVPSSDGSFVLTVKVSVVDGDAVILKEEKFNFTITRPNVPLLNTVNSFDVDANGRVEALDALRIINFLARKLGSDVQALADLSKFFYDTNGSNSITAADALSVINQIARLSRSNAGSGESTSTFAVELNSKSKRADAALEGYLAEPRLF